MASSSSSSASSSGFNSDGGDQPGSGSESTNGSYECNICLDTAKDAVVSLCGHLFCWPCLHQWLEMRPNGATCPVCKSAISRDKVVPLYGRGSSNQNDPRDKVPPRPQGQRTEPENRAGFHNFQFGGGGGGGSFHTGGFHMSFGIGGFPFGVFSSFNVNPTEHGSNTSAEGVQPSGEQQFMSQFFLIIAFVFIFWTLLA